MARKSMIPFRPMAMVVRVNPNPRGRFWSLTPRGQGPVNDPYYSWVPPLPPHTQKMVKIGSPTKNAFFSATSWARNKIKTVLKSPCTQLNFDKKQQK